MLWRAVNARADDTGASVLRGVAFATLGLGGLLAAWFVLRLPERA